VGRHGPSPSENLGAGRSTHSGGAGQSRGSKQRCHWAGRRGGLTHHFITYFSYNFKNNAHTL
jgi:hypothetical protein